MKQMKTQEEREREICEFDLENTQHWTGEKEEHELFGWIE